VGQEAARRNLWRLIEGIRVDNHRLMDELILRNAELKQRLQGLIQKAETMAEKESAGGRTEIKLQMGFDGPFTEALLAVLPVSSPGRPPFRFGPPANNPAPIGPRFILGPTGLVVDARGLKVEPALAPQILAEDGGLIYGLSKVSRSYVVHQGLAVYMRDMALAEASPRVANNPITVKAVELAPETSTDLVISDRDAEHIRRVSRQYDFLYKCRVIIVIDQLKGMPETD
jgi:hypothetical protein